MCLISDGCWFAPEVINSCAVYVNAVCNLAFPCSHFQDKRNQKHFWRLSALPVLYNNLSHSCETLCKLVTSFCSADADGSPWVLLVPRPASSTNASPTKVIGSSSFTGWIIISGTVGVSAEKINKKQRSHRNGPIVEPWPGPYKIRSGWLAYPWVEIPYSVFILWNVCTHVAASDATAVTDIPKIRRKINTSGLMMPS